MGQFNTSQFVVVPSPFGGSAAIRLLPQDPTSNVDEWIMTDAQWSGSAQPGSHPGGYNVAGVADFTGSGTDGILWFNPTTGNVDEWVLQGGAWHASINLQSHPGSFSISGVGDFNGDGTADVLWTNSSGGAIQTDIWELAPGGQWMAACSLDRIPVAMMSPG